MRKRRPQSGRPGSRPAVGGVAVRPLGCGRAAWVPAARPGCGLWGGPPLRGGHDLLAGSLEPSRARRASRGVWWYACVSVYLRRDFAGGASVVVPGLGRGHGQIRAAPCRPPSYPSPMIPCWLCWLPPAPVFGPVQQDVRQSMKGRVHPPLAALVVVFVLVYV